MTRQELFTWIRQQYGTEPEYPWHDWNAVLRHNDNNKWYGVVLEVSADKLGLPEAGIIDVLNVKSDPLLIGSLRGQDGYFPAYHIYLFDKDVFFHVDATQSFGKLVDELRVLKYDMLSMSAHKLGGPQGIGALILKKKRYKLPPVKNIMYGGPQEHGVRPGTTPVALVAGLGKACELAVSEYKENAEKCCAIRNCLLQMLKESGTSYQINGNLQYCVPNTLNICFDGISSEALMLATKQYCSISNGSACNSHSYSPSYVLTAMGLPEEQIESSIRVSWGALTDIQLVQIEFGRLLEYVKGMQ